MTDVIVHVLQEGLPICGFSHEVPAKWPEGHKWLAAHELKELRDVTCPSCREAVRRVVDQKFVRAGHRPENNFCDHKQYDLERHGRYCPCGTAMWDPGD